MDVDVVLRPLQDPRWSAFVASHGGALAFHHPSWAVMLAECYRFRAFCLTVDDRAGRILAGLPVVEVYRPGRPRWVSLPFTDECPPLVTPGVGIELAGRLDELRRAFGVRRFEIRAELCGERVQRGDAFLSHQLPLEGSEADIFASLHANQVRRNIRRAERAGVKVRPGDSEADVTEIFYRLHLATRHRLGLPVQPLRYFRLLWQRFLQPGLGAVIIAELDGVAVAAAVFLAYGETCIYKYGASDERHWDARPNHLLFWEAIRWARARGCRTFDFGRTDLADKGLREFKSRWGTVERELAYSVLADRPSRPNVAGLPTPLRSAIRRGPLFIPRVLGEVFYRHTA